MHPVAGLPKAPPSVVVGDKPSPKAERHPFLTEGEFIVRWDGSIATPDRAVRIAVSGDHSEVTIARNGKATNGSSLSFGRYAPGYVPNEDDRALMDATLAMKELADSKGGRLESGRRYTLPTVAISGENINDNNELIDAELSQTVRRGDFDITVVQPGKGADIYLRGALKSLEKYPTPIAHIVEAAQRLALHRHDR